MIIAAFPLVALPLYERPQSRAIMVPCPMCSGDAWGSYEGRHARTTKDVCQTCKGERVIPADTGTSQSTSAPAAVPDPGEVEAEAKRYLGVHTRVDKT